MTFHFSKVLHVCIFSTVGVESGRQDSGWAGYTYTPTYLKHLFSSVSCEAYSSSSSQAFSLSFRSTSVIHQQARRSDIQSVRRPLPHTSEKACSAQSEWIQSIQKKKTKNKKQCEVNKSNSGYFRLVNTSALSERMVQG